MPRVPNTKTGWVLDLAAGDGRHTLLALEMGYQVLAVDWKAAALLALKEQLPTALSQQLQVLELDLEQPIFPAIFNSFEFNGIIVTNYLYRPHLNSFIDLLASQGVLIYETFATGNEPFGKPSNPDFLLKKDELWQYIAPREDFSMIAFEQGYVALPKPAVIQRICAVKQNRIGLQLENDEH